MGRQGYSAEFRRKVLDLLAEGRSVASVAHDLELTRADFPEQATPSARG